MELQDPEEQKREYVMYHEEFVLPAEREWIAMQEKQARFMKETQTGGRQSTP
jgi:hypothetical protein